MTTKGTVGRVAVVPSDMPQVIYSPQICYFRVADSTVIDRGYLLGWLRSADAAHQASSLMYSSDMAPYLSMRDIRVLRMPMPTITEQRTIGAALWKVQEAVHALESESRCLARMRDTLLPLLMSGKLRVKDAERSLQGVL